MVAPVRASLEKVDEQIRAMERERGTAYGALRQQMQTISETQEKLRDATGSLVSALKAPAVRGRWGEMQLRRVVELAGMLEHCDFDEQVTRRRRGRAPAPRHGRAAARAGATSSSTPRRRWAPIWRRGRRPTTRRAPRSCASTPRRCAPTSEAGREELLGRVDASPDMVVMFLPGEPLYSVALEQMPELIEEGVAQKVMLATPTTLLGAAAHGQLRLARRAAGRERPADQRRGAPRCTSGSPRCWSTSRTSAARSTSRSSTSTSAAVVRTAG